MDLRWNLEDRIRELQLLVNKYSIGGYKARCEWLVDLINVNKRMIVWLDDH